VPEKGLLGPIFAAVIWAIVLFVVLYAIQCG